VIAAATARPGVVLKRPVGSNAAFKEQAGLPTGLADGGSQGAARKPAAGKKKHPRQANDRAAERKGALALEKEQKRRAREAEKQEAARQRERERRQNAVSKVQSALDAAHRKHDRNAASIEVEIEALEKKAQAEKARWEKERGRLEAALKQARG